MQILLVGVNHKAAPVAIREKIAFDSESSVDAMQKLKAAYPDCEFVLLSTCNRVECYAAAYKSYGLTPHDIMRFLCGLKKADYADISPYYYIKLDEEAVRHLLTVSSSLDSMVLGENQILAQVKESYKRACDAGSSGKILNHLFHAAFHTAKDVVNTTSICNRRISVAGVAVNLAKKLLPDIRAARIVVVGAGQMAELLLERFRDSGCRQMVIVNRTSQRACQVADKFAVRRQSREMLQAEIAVADIIVGAAGADKGYLCGPEAFETRIKNSDNRPLLAIDIAVPRSFDPAIGDIDGVCLRTIDDLAQEAKDNMKLREGDLEQAVENICMHTDEFMEWFETRNLGPLIGQIRDAFVQAQDTDAPAAGSGINKALHSVVTSIRTIAKQRGVGEAERFARQIVDSAGDILRQGAAPKTGDQ